MLRLDGSLPLSTIASVAKYTELRLRNASSLLTAEAFALHEQRFLPDSQIKILCEDTYGVSLYEPSRSYVPAKIIADFDDTNIVPISYNALEKEVICVYLKDIGYLDISNESSYKVTLLPTTIYFFLSQYQRVYGAHTLLNDIPAKLLLSIVIEEAVELGAADITISSLNKGCEVYYNIRKTKVRSNRTFTQDKVKDVIKYLTIHSPMDFTTRAPKYVDVDLTPEYRGRVVISTKHKGYCLTIRLLPNNAFDSELEALNLSPNTIAFLREDMQNKESGLRLIVGSTMSGKNTTALALLHELVRSDTLKVCSVEMPVEQTLIGVEQINTETLEEFDENIKSLIHQNPDFVYITEIKDATGLSVFEITNTGKRVLSTLHSNSVADTLTRLSDITKLSYDRIVQTLHSIIYQELVRDEATDTVRPYNKYIRFTKELKYNLYGKSLGEMIKLVSDGEEGDTWM